MVDVAVLCVACLMLALCCDPLHHAPDFAVGASACLHNTAATVMLYTHIVSITDVQTHGVEGR